MRPRGRTTALCKDGGGWGRWRHGPRWGVIVACAQKKNGRQRMAKGNREHKQPKPSSKKRKRSRFESLGVSNGQKNGGRKEIHNRVCTGRMGAKDIGL